MPAITKPWDHPAREIGYRQVNDIRMLAYGARVDLDARNKLKTFGWSLSTPGEDASSNTLKTPMRPSGRGLIDAIMMAYNDHHHLALRPDDIWTQILSQFSGYVNRHAEELREHFVSHQGQKELVVFLPRETTRHTLDCGEFAREMGAVIKANVKNDDHYAGGDGDGDGDNDGDGGDGNAKSVDKGKTEKNDSDNLAAWVEPDFSTTTEHDRQVASVLLMATMQRYFSYTGRTRCGIPSVTLAGERADYEKLLARLDRLERYGAEPARFAALLRPIMRGFIATFDTPESARVQSFWRRICNIRGRGSGRTRYCGWMTAFCFWDNEGTCLYTSGKMARVKAATWSKVAAGLSGDLLEGAVYQPVEELPNGLATVPIKIEDSLGDFKAEMTVGSVAVAYSSSGGKVEQKYDVDRSDPDKFKVRMVAGRLDTVQPVTGWWVLELPEAGPPGRDYQCNVPM